MGDLKKTTGNILSNVSPPSELPSFITANVATAGTDSVTNPTTVDDAAKKDETDPFIPTTFSPAIPPSKDTSLLTAGYPMEVDVGHQNPDHAAEPTFGDVAGMTLNPEPVAAALTPLTQGGSALFGWMKDAVSGSGILQKVAEKAKNSVDTIVTTLDPQMKEYINSGGDTEVIVASDKDDKVRPIREAFQTVFGKATVIGLAAQPTEIAAQPVGFAAGIEGAKMRINIVRTENPRVDDQLPVVAIENFIVELSQDTWFEGGVMMLYDYARCILLTTFTQMIPISSDVVNELKEGTSTDYPLKDTGFAVTIGSVMARNLNTPHTEWHRAYTSVSRPEMILAAAKTMATLYKQRRLKFEHGVKELWAWETGAGVRQVVPSDPSEAHGGEMSGPAE